MRVQENSDEIPAGSMPRSIDIILRHEIVERAKAGDKCVFVGTVIVIPDVGSMMSGNTGTLHSGGDGRQSNNTGFSGLKQAGVKEMSYKLAFLASSVQMADEHYGTYNIRSGDGSEEDVVSSFTDDERHEIASMKNSNRLYERMARSIAPNIFGHEEVKRGILLMLFGGVHKKTSSGTNLRGDINICIVGDPSTAKSKFLQYVCTFVPRAVYTSGKASSAAGLTASVTRDPDTGEFCIEAGALMLADNGICCIDEVSRVLGVV
jgi:DNA replication licensing factor MCM6